MQRAVLAERTLCCRERSAARNSAMGQLPLCSVYIYIYWVLTKKVAKKIRLYVAQET